jgi:hypothetical protein
MLEGLDNRSSLRPAVEQQVLRTVRQRVLDASFQILPFAIAKMIEAVGAGRGAYIIAIGKGFVVYPGTESTDLMVISRVAILFCTAIVCAMDWPAGKGLSKG